MRTAGKRIISGSVSDWSRTSLKNTVGNDFVDPNVRIGMVMDSDATRFMYPYEDPYPQYEKNAGLEIGNDFNSDGSRRVNSFEPRRQKTSGPMTGSDFTGAHVNLNNKMLGKNYTQEGMEQSPRLFVEDPLTLLNLRKINMTSNNMVTRVNSLATMTVIIGGIVYYLKKNTLTTEDNQKVILLGIIFAIILFISMRRKEGYSFAEQDQTTGTLYQPRDIDTSIEMNERNFDPYKWKALYGPRPYPASNIRY